MATTLQIADQETTASQTTVNVGCAPSQYGGRELDAPVSLAAGREMPPPTPPPRQPVSGLY